jgi:phosphoglycerate kinase
MNLKSVEEINPNSKVVLRMDTDLPIENNIILDNSRLVKSIPTIKFLLEKKCKIVIIGHRGRPTNSDAVLAGKPNNYDENLTLKPVYLELMSLLNNSINSVFLDDINDEQKINLALENNEIVFLENLRFWKEEENDDPFFLEDLVKICQFYVNDAFAVAHRKNASIMLYKRMPALYGFSFIEEAKKIEQILQNPQKPITVVLGGAKEDKLKYLSDLEKIADYILIGGKLPKLIQNPENSKVIIAKLNENGLDLSEEDVEKFSEIILQSRTIVWAGALGYYEKEENRKGTNEIARAIADADAYKIIAGGDTSASIVDLGLRDKIDFICSGGGVMLEYLTKGKLVAWEE